MKSLALAFLFFISVQAQAVCTGGATGTIACYGCLTNNTDGTDLCGQYNMTVNGTVTFGSSSPPQGTSFTGFSDSNYLSAANGALLAAMTATASSYTVQAYVNLTSLGNYDTMISSDVSPVAVGYDFFGFNQSTGAMRWGSSTSTISDSNSNATGSWHHYAWTYDGTTRRFYIDNVAKDTSVSGAAWSGLTSKVFYIGRYSQSGVGIAMQGLISQLRLMSTVETSFPTLDPAPVVTNGLLSPYMNPLQQRSGFVNPRRIQ